MKRKLISQLKLGGGFLFILFMIWWFSKFPDSVEQIYSQKLFPFFAGTGQRLFSLLPFSVGDCFYGLLFGCFLLSGTRILRRLWLRRYQESLLVFLKNINIILLLAIIFYLFWGLNYFRVPLEKKMMLDMQVGDLCELVESTAICIDRANAYRTALSASDLERSDAAIFHQASRLLTNSSTLNPYLFICQPNVKSPISNWHANHTMVAGYFNPFTQETQVNTAMPLFSKPFTACHELGHQAGIGFEDEANLIGFIVCAESNDKLFCYSAYYQAMFMLLNQVFLEDKASYFHLLQLIDPKVKQDADNENAFWRQYDGVLNEASSKFYDGYLQFNNQPEGLKRYNRMTKLLLAWMKKQPYM